MNIEKKIKLNCLLNNWARSLVMTSNLLIKKGYSYQLVNRYVKSGWIKELGQGAYLKLNESPTIFGVLSALQEQLELQLHLGGLSSLEYYGFAQYSNLSSNNLYYIYNSDCSKSSLPHWSKNNEVKIKHINKHLFITNSGIVKKEKDGLQFNIARPERAILELLALVPNIFSLQFANDNLENLQLLDAELMQKLLEECASIKVKRLFLYLAQSNKLPCFDFLLLSRINLGKGKRVIGDGGTYIQEYKISISKLNVEEGVPDV